MRRSQHQSQSLPPQQPTAGHHYSPGLESTLSDPNLYCIVLRMQYLGEMLSEVVFLFYRILMQHFAKYSYHIKISELASVIPVAKKI